MLSQSFFSALTGLFNGMETMLYQFRSVAKPEHVTPVQYSMMEYLYFNENKSVGDISQCMFLSMPNASREIKKLKELGLLDKQVSNSDKRTIYIKLSAEGRKTMDQAFERIFELANKMYPNLSADKQNEVIESIGKIEMNLFSQ